MDDTPYTNEELAKAGDGFPERGVICPKCRTKIPQFVELDDETEVRIRKLIRENRPLNAIEELKAATGCPHRWAKIWVVHSGRPALVFPGPPCPYCGKELRTATARQCPHCFMAWHDEKNPKKLV